MYGKNISTVLIGLSDVNNVLVWNLLNMFDLLFSYWENKW